MNTRFMRSRACMRHLLSMRMPVRLGVPDGLIGVTSTAVGETGATIRASYRAEKGSTEREEGVSACSASNTRGQQPNARHTVTKPEILPRSAKLLFGSEMNVVLDTKPYNAIRHVQALPPLSLPSAS
jgi:hypothetical protein